MERGYDMDNILVIDLEFANTYKKHLNKAAIMEVGMVFASNLGLANEKQIKYSKMFNPGVKVNWYVRKVTGITTSMIRDLDPVQDSHNEIQSFIDKADTLLFHGGNLDIRALRNSGFELQGKTMLDTLTLAQCSPREFDSHSLKDLAKDLGINCQGAHRALNDAKMTLNVYKQLMLINKSEIHKQKKRL